MTTTIYTLLLEVLNKQLILIWDKFKAKNAKVATAISLILGSAVLVSNLLLSSPEAVDQLGKFAEYLKWAISIIGFILTSINGASTYNDMQKIKQKEEQPLNKEQPDDTN